MRFIIGLFLLCVNYQLYSQECLSVPLSEQGTWHIVDQDSLSSGTKSWTLLHPGERQDDYSECITIQQTATALNLSVDQVINRTVQNARQEFQRGKITMIEKRIGIDVRPEWGIFSIESPAPKKGGSSQTILFFILMGEEHTYIVQRKTLNPKLSSSEKKEWKKLFKAAKLQSQEMEQALTEMNISRSGE
ncbi:MAG: hypothetical protein AAFR59_06625 [Bacteroidota bacterium]